MSTTAVRAPAVIRVDDAAAYLSVNPKTIRRMVWDGRLRATRLGSGPNAPVRIPVAELERLIGAPLAA